MKTDYIKQIQENIGVRMGQYVQGLTAWLDGAITKMTDEGDVEVEFTVRAEMLNPMGNIHGGSVAAMIDEILGFQLFIKAAEDAAYVSMTMNIDFLRAAQEGEVITAIPKVIRIGRRTANVACVLKNQEGKIIAQGGSNFMRIS